MTTITFCNANKYKKYLRNNLKLIRFLLLGSFFILFTIRGIGQTDFQLWYDTELPHFDSLLNLNGPDSMEGTGYNNFMHNYFMWAPVLSPNKSMDSYDQQFKQNAQNYSAGTEITGNSPQWRIVGPKGGIGDNYNGFTGQIHYIYKSPHNPLVYFACSPTGGLFISKNAGMDWENAGTDKGLEHCGVSSVVVDSDNANTWFIATGHGEMPLSRPAWQTAIGVYRTIDEGATWINISQSNNLLNNAKRMRKIIQVNADSSYLIVTASNGLWATSNADDPYPVWHKLIGGEFYDVISSPDSNYILYASGTNTTGVYKFNLLTYQSELLLSPDDVVDPDTITVDGIDLTHRRITIKIAPPNHNYLYASFTMRDFGYLNVIYRYNITQKTWVNRGKAFRFNIYEKNLSWDIRPSLNDDGYIEIYSKAFNSPRLYIDSLDNNNKEKAIVKSINTLGDNSHADGHYWWFDPNDNEKIWMGNDGGLWYGNIDPSNDTIITWYQRNRGLAVANIEHVAVSPDELLVTSGQFDDGSFTYRTTDGTYWQDWKVDGGDGYQTVVVSKDKYYTSAQNGIINLTDGNQSFSFYANRTPDCLSDDTIFYANFHTYYQRSVYDNLYLAGQKEVLKHDNNGWSEFTNFSDVNSYPEMGCRRSGTWQVEVVNDNLMYASTYGNSFSSADPNHYYYYQIYRYPGGSGLWQKIGNKPDNNWVTAIKKGYYPSTRIFAAMAGKIYDVHWDTYPSNATWDNITYNLSSYGVQAINAIDKDNNRIFVATDNGVFYKNKNGTTWIKYSHHLPNVNVKDIKLVNNSVYVGTYGRGVWYASSPVCDTTYDTVKIVQNTLYDIDKTVYDVIVVYPGATLTVTAILRMGANAKIIVQRGAKLDVNGGTITKACPDPWPGIEVWGDINNLQTSTYQGVVMLRNHATIEYALTAIATINNNGSFSDLTYTGGIINADFSTFHNNYIDVYFYPWDDNITGSITPLDNVSYFNNCRFYTDTSYYYYFDSAYIHVLLDGVRGIKFTANTFENIVSLNFADMNIRGIGIGAWNSGFYAVKYGETESDANHFNYLNYGIRTYALSGSNKTIKIDTNLFIKNQTGCYLGAETFASVTRNVFDVTRKDGLLPDGYCGIYLDASTGYQVEENEFYSDYNPQIGQSYSKSFGLVVNNSGPDNNQIYNNYFHNITYATQAQGENRSKDGSTGLTIKCNDYQDNYQDISVTADGTGSLYGIKSWQGSNTNLVTAPAGNTFSHIGSVNNLYSDYYNACEDIKYWHHMQGLGSTVWVVPTYHNSPEVDPTPNPFNLSYDKNGSCPSNLNNKSYSDTKSNIASAESNRLVYTDSLTSLVDGGNTTATNLDVVTSMPPETMQLRDELLSASPYLSDTVMVNAAEKEDVLPNSIITEILSENPQSAKSDKVINKLNERVLPPNDNQMTQIHANDTVIGHKESLESKRDHYAGEKAQETYRLIRMFASDTSVLSKNDSIETALSNINSPSSMYKQAFCRFSRGDSAGVIAVLNNIPSEFDLSNAQTDYYNYFEDYFEVLLTLQSQQKFFSQIDSTQKAVLYNILNNSHGQLQAYARNLLIHTDGLAYDEPYIAIDTSQMKTATAENHITYGEILKQNSWFKLYPNPAREYITLEYDLDYGTTNAVIEIVNLNGVHIETFRLSGFRGVKVIDLRNRKPGTYLIRLTINGKTLQNEKFIKL